MSRVNVMNDRVGRATNSCQIKEKKLQIQSLGQNSIQPPQARIKPKNIPHSKQLLDPAKYIDIIQGHDHRLL